MIDPKLAYGGSRYLSIVGNLTLRKNSPSVINLASTGAFSVILPVVGVPVGKRHHLINGSAFDLSVYGGADLLFSLPAGKVATVRAVTSCDGSAVEWRGAVRDKNPTSPRPLRTSAVTNPCGGAVVTLPDGGGGCPGLTDALDQLVIDFPNTLTGIKVGSCCLGAQFGIDSFPAKGQSASFTYNGTDFIYTTVSDPGTATSQDPTAPGDGFPCPNDGTSVLLIVEPA